MGLSHYVSIYLAILYMILILPLNIRDNNNNVETKDVTLVTNAMHACCVSQSTVKTML